MKFLGVDQFATIKSQKPKLVYTGDMQSLPERRLQRVKFSADLAHSKVSPAKYWYYLPYFEINFCRRKDFVDSMFVHL